MQLRLKRRGESLYWDVYTRKNADYFFKMIGTVEGEAINRDPETNGFAAFRSNEGKWTRLIKWCWNNKYATEYRKMRAALVDYLEPKVEVHPEELVWAEVVKGLGEKLEAAELKAMEQATKITQLEAAHEGLANKMMECTEVIVDLRTQLRQSEERNKELCQENWGLINAMDNLKIGYVAKQKNDAMVEAAKVALSSGYSAKRDMMVQEIRKQAKKVEEALK